MAIEANLMAMHLRYGQKATAKCGCVFTSTSRTPEKNRSYLQVKVDHFCNRRRGKSARRAHVTWKNRCALNGWTRIRKYEWVEIDAFDQALLESFGDQK